MHRALSHAGTFVFNKNTPGGSVHPTQKPLPLMRDLVSLFASAGELVCDPFAGAGTTGVACIKLGRRFVGIEVNEEHFDTSCEQISKAYAQPDFFVERAPEPKQEPLFGMGMVG